jgi:lysophospholipase L1-like esterase
MTLCPSITNLSRAAFALVFVWSTVYSTANAESALLTKARAGENVKVVLLGTSLTAAGSWPGSLNTWLNSESHGPGSVTVINRAVSGKASNHGVSVQLPLALEDEPDVVFIEFSMNDAASSLNITQQEATDNLNTMINALVAQNPNVIIILQTMNNVATNTSPFSARPNLNAYYQIYRDAAVVHGAILIDHYPNWQNLFTTDLTRWNSYMKDAVHPNALGQTKVLMPELKAVLGGVSVEQP